MTKVPHWILRRFASRCVDILSRLGDEEPSLALYRLTLGKSAPEYLTAYQAVVAYETARGKKIQRRETSLKSLLRKLRTWTAALAKDIGIERARFGDRPTVPEEVINDTIELLAVVARHEEEGHEMPFYTEDLRSDLASALESAQTDLSAAGGSHVRLTELRAALHAAAANVQSDLVAFRRALRAYFGSSHPDYQRLRMPRNSQDLLDAEEGEPATDGEPSAESSGVSNESIDMEDDDAEEDLDQAS